MCIPILHIICICRCTQQSPPVHRYTEPPHCFYVTYNRIITFFIYRNHYYLLYRYLTVVIIIILIIVIITRRIIILIANSEPKDVIFPDLTITNHYSTYSLFFSDVASVFFFF